MPLPVRTALADIEAICRYLFARPEGATPATLGDIFDLRKLFALKFWGLVTDDGSVLRLTARGRRAVHDGGAHRESALQEVVVATPPYAAVIARAVACSEPMLFASDVAARWQQHFKSDCQFGILNHQIVCFFRIAEGAGLAACWSGARGSRRPSSLRKPRPGPWSRQSPRRRASPVRLPMGVANPLKRRS
jgi:hypothetical protein